MQYIETPEGWEVTLENDVDAVEILTSAMFKAHLYGNEYYSPDVSERVRVKIKFDDPVGIMMLLVQGIVRQMGNQQRLAA